MEHYEIRTELQKQHSHVTFVKSEINKTIWTINDNMEKISIGNNWVLSDILPMVAKQQLEESKKGSKINGNKLRSFYLTMDCGAIPCDYKLYDKYTQSQLFALRRDKMLER